MRVPPPELTHRCHDIEVERIGEPPGAHLIKILALDGRRFTYLVKAGLDAEAVAFVKKMIDSGMVSDLVIERIDGRLEARPAATRLKKHG